MSTTEQANDTRHYITLTLAIIVVLIGVYLRFFIESSVLSNIIMVIGVIITLRTVFAILK